MRSLKNIISLNQASKISGYTQDYLGYLVRRGEIEGIKKGGIWFTTEEEIRQYLLKQKVSHKKSTSKDFFQKVFHKKIVVGDSVPNSSYSNFLVISLLVFLGISSAGFYIFEQNNYDQISAPQILSASRLSDMFHPVNFVANKIVLVNEKINSVENKIAKGADTLESKINSLNRGVENKIAKNINSLGDGINSVGNKIAKRADTLESKINSLNRGVENKIAKNINSLGDGINSFGKEISYAGNKIVENTDAVGNRIAMGINFVGNGIIKSTDTLGNGIASSLNNSQKFFATISLPKISSNKIAKEIFPNFSEGKKKEIFSNLSEGKKKETSPNLPKGKGQIQNFLLLASVGDSISSTGNFLTSISDGIAYGWSEFTFGILNNIKDTANGTKKFASSIFRARQDLAQAPTVSNPTVPVPTTSIPTKQDKILTPTSSQASPVVTNKTIVQRITEKPQTTIINQIDQTLLSRIEGIELAISNNINHNIDQTHSTYDSVSRMISRASGNITSEGILNDSTLNNPHLTNGTFSGSTIIGKVEDSDILTVNNQATFAHPPSLAHSFTLWPAGTSNISDSSLYINPASATADSNLLGLAVNGTAKFLVDAEGDIYGNNLILTGSTSTGSTVIGGNLGVQDNTTLGDSATDIVTIHGVTTLDNSFSQTGANTFSTGTGAVSLNGATTISGGDLSLGTNNLKMTGSLGENLARLTKGWFTDLEVANTIVGSISGNAGTVTNGVYTSRTVNGHALSSDVIVTASDVGLGNVTNESKATMFTSPTFTGTVGGFTMGGNLVLGANTLSTTSGLITPKIYPSVDSTTAFQINKADGMTNVLNVDTTNGYVGVGTTTPATLLEISKSNYPEFAITDTQVGGVSWRLASGRNTAGDFDIAQGTGTKLTIQKTTGNVGIGTKAPSSLLHIKGNNSVFGIEQTKSGSENNWSLGYSSGNASLILQPTTNSLFSIRDKDSNFAFGFSTSTLNTGFGVLPNSTNRVLIQGATIDNTKNAINITNSSAASLFLVRNDGNVGIGTTTPNQQLEITKNFRLPSTTYNGGSPYGIIYKEDTPFIHNFNYGLNGNGITTAGGNTFVGINAGNLTMGSTATTVDQASYNTGIGEGALQLNTTGYFNSALGYRSLYSNTTGYANSAQGVSSLFSNTTGNTNSAQGYTSLYSNTTGYSNSAQGNASLYSNTTGSGNSAIGRNSGRYITDGSTGNTTGSYSVFLGYNTRAHADGETNQIVIGYNAIGNGSNTVTIGNSSITGNYFTGLGSFTGGLITPKIYPSADSTTAFQINKADGTTNVLNVDTTNGRVGIGTTNPGAKLEVAAIAFSSNQSNGIRLNDVGNHWSFDLNIKTSSSGSPRFGIDTYNTSDVFTILPVGNVGIGTTGPKAKLEVAGEIRSDAVTGGSYYWETWTTADGGAGHNTAWGIKTHEYSLGDKYSLTWKANGNVGIGLTNPTAALHLKAGTATTGTAPLKFTSGTLLTTPESGAVEYLNDDLYLTSTTGTTRRKIGGSGMQTPIWYPTTNSTTALQINQADGTTNVLNVDTTNGRVGIGTTAPGNTLHIQDTSMQLRLATGATTYWDIGRNGADGNFHIDDDTLGTLFTISQTDGSVGIGTTAPSQQLEITKNFKLPETGSDSTVGVIYKGSNRFVHDFYPTGATDAQNLFIGANSGNFTMTAPNAYNASLNTGIGSDTLTSLTTGYQNLAIGAKSLQYVTSGNANMALGYTALRNITTGSGNVAIGSYAGRYIAGGAVNTTSSGSIYLGYNTKASAQGTSNEIVIGYDAIGAGSNKAVIGSSALTDVYFGSTTPNARLWAKGLTLSAGTATTGTAPLKFTSGTLLTTPESGAVEYLNDDLYLTSTTGTTRRKIGGSGMQTPIWYPTTNSTTALQINQADGTTNILNVDTTNGYVGIGTTAPGDKLHIYNGNIRLGNQSDGFARIFIDNSPYQATPMTLMNAVSRDSDSQSRVDFGGGTVVGYAATQLSFYTASNRITTSGTERMTINSVGNVGIGTIYPTNQLTQKSTTALESATLGSELLSSSNWTSTDWTGDFSSGFTHTTGNTTALSNTLSATNGYLYQITYTVTGRTAGTFTVTFGGVTSDSSYSSTNTFGPKATSTGSFSITPTTDFDGKIVISIKQITGTYNATYAIQDSTGTNSFEIRNSLASLRNTFIGFNSGRYNTTGNANSVQGNASLYSNTTGNYNSAQGYQSLYSNTTGNSNSAIGFNSLYSNISGNSNSAFGHASLYNNTTGYNNSAFGVNSLQSNITGYNNTAQGYASLYSNTTGSSNSAQGMFSLYSSKTGSSGVAVGYESQKYANDTTTAWTNMNTSVGYQSLRGSATAANNTGNSNTAVGYQALLNNTTGGNNSAQGYSSLYSNTTGNYNSAQGYSSLYSNTTGNYNSAQGRYSLYSNTTGSNNSAQGVNSLYVNTTGSNNSALGVNAGRYITDGATGNTTGSNSVFLGYDTRAQADGQTNQIVIGSGAIGNGSNTVTIGNSSITGNYFTGLGSFTGGLIAPKIYPSVDSTTAFQINKADGTTNVLNVDTTNGKVGIGTTSPTKKLTISQSNDLDGFRLYGYTIPTNYFDFYINNLGNPRFSSNASMVFESDADNIFRGANFYVQGAGGNTKLFVNNSGSVGIGTTTPSAQLTQKSTTDLESATLGSELLSSSNWTSTDWTGDFSSGFTHTTGNTTALTNTLSATNGYIYQITYTVTGMTAGTFNITFGGVTKSGISATGAWGPKATSTGTLSITPTSDFDGTIAISIKQITGTYNATYAIQDSTGANAFEIRNSLASLKNNFIGIGSGQSNTTGYYNSAQGYYSLASNTTGYYNSAQGVSSLSSNTVGINNSAQGYKSLYSNTIGSNNSAQGYQSLNSNTTGSNNSAQGVTSLNSNTTGSNNSAQGYASLSSNTTGSGNSAVGFYAGRYIADGTTGRSTGDYGLYLGYNTKASANGTSNEIVIGYDAIGMGSNTAVFGNTSVTDNYFNGALRQTSCVTAGTISVDATGKIICTPSSIQFKNERNDLTEGLATLLMLNPVSYKFNENMNMGSEVHFGFIAEEADSVLPQFATHDKDGKAYGLDTNAILAVTVNAIKEMNLKVEDLSSLDIARATSLGSLIKNFLADIGNGLEKIFVREVNTRNLCVSDESGGKTCVTKAQLDTLLASVGDTGNMSEEDVALIIDNNLAKAKTDASDLVKEDYTEESWSTFTTALITALELPETNDEEKIIKTSAINDAIAGLEKVSEEQGGGGTVTCTLPEILEGGVCVTPQSGDGSGSGTTEGTGTGTEVGAGTDGGADTGTGTTGETAGTGTEASGGGEVGSDIGTTEGTGTETGAGTGADTGATEGAGAGTETESTGTGEGSGTEAGGGTESAGGSGEGV